MPQHKGVEFTWISRSIPWRRAITLFAHIFIPKHYADTPGRVDRAICHELIHKIQQKLKGMWKWTLEYFESAMKQLGLEAPAFRKSIEWWQEQGIYELDVGEDELVPVLDFYVDHMMERYTLIGELDRDVVYGYMIAELNE